jgi:DNA-binding transcriptional ArsR family regulator
MLAAAASERCVRRLGGMRGSEEFFSMTAKAVKKTAARTKHTSGSVLSGVSKSALTHHWRVLRDAGVTRIDARRSGLCHCPGCHGRRSAAGRRHRFGSVQRAVAPGG